MIQLKKTNQTLASKLRETEGKAKHSGEALQELVTENKNLRISVTQTTKETVKKSASKKSAKKRIAELHVKVRNPLCS
jgi:4-hydroxy-3-methylbut-2-enyl diphosphate reductase IspH